MYIILVNSSYHVEGDERSRTNPGHGYPAEDVDYVEAIEFHDSVEVEEWILANGDRKKYRLFQCTPVTIEKKISLTFTEASNGAK